jgi:acetylcholinesterase
MTSTLLFLVVIFFINILSAEPIVHSSAGIYHGRHLPSFYQDVFLGIKYAAKPVRFSPSVLASDSPKVHFNASSYGTDCYSFGTDTATLTSEGFTIIGEDCLHLNIVKPTCETKGLPVLLWIYGGGWFSGATSDPR